MGHSAVRAAWLAGATPSDTVTSPGTVRARVQLPQVAGGARVLVTCTLHQDEPGRTAALDPVAFGHAVVAPGAAAPDVDVTLTPFDPATSPSPQRAVLVRTDITYCSGDILVPFSDEWKAAVTTTAAVANLGPVTTEPGQHLTLTSTLTQERRPGAHGKDAFAFGLETDSTVVASPDESHPLLVTVGPEWGKDLRHDQLVILTNEVRFTCSSLLQPGADSPLLHQGKTTVPPTWSLWDWES